MSKRTFRQRDRVVSTFDQEAGMYFNKYAGGTVAAHSFVVRRQRVIELLRGCEGKKILDVGCGPGIAVDDFARNGCDYFGVDISEEMIKECRNRFGHLSSAHFSVGTIERLEFPESFFDFVICMGVVEYLEDDGVALREMERVVKSGGVIVVTLPNRSSPYRLWDRAVYRRVAKLAKRLLRRGSEPELIHREYHEASYRMRVEESHLEVVDIVYYNFKLVLSPFDRLFPRLTVALSQRMEFLCRSRLRWLGTGFIAKLKKTHD